VNKKNSTVSNPLFGVRPHLKALQGGGCAGRREVRGKNVGINGTAAQYPPMHARTTHTHTHTHTEHTRALVHAGSDPRSDRP
jgi:hypothetical protein